MKTIELIARDVDVIKEIILENKVGTFLLSTDDGEADTFSALNIQFEQSIKGRLATVIIPVR